MPNHAILIKQKKKPKISQKKLENIKNELEKDFCEPKKLIPRYL